MKPDVIFSSIQLKLCLPENMRIFFHLSFFSNNHILHIFFVKIKSVGKIVEALKEK